MLLLCATSIWLNAFSVVTNTICFCSRGRAMASTRAGVGRAQHCEHDACLQQAECCMLNSLVEHTLSLDHDANVALWSLAIPGPKGTARSTP